MPNASKTPPAADSTLAPAEPAAPAVSVAPAAPAPEQRMRWKTDQLKSSYVNFVNANSTQEEVVLNFGMNNNWDRNANEIEIDLAHRIVMSPFAAKRLAEMLARLIDQYESRHGAMK